MAQQSVFDDRYPRPKQQKKEGDSFSASLGNDDTLETVFERTVGCPGQEKTRL